MKVIFCSLWNKIGLITYQIIPSLGKQTRIFTFPPGKKSLKWAGELCVCLTRQKIPGFPHFCKHQSPRSSFQNKFN